MPAGHSAILLGPQYTRVFTDAGTPQFFPTIGEAVEEVQAGRMVVVVDDEDRENEGDLTLAAEKVTPATINFMARYGRGLVCLTLTEERLDHLRIPRMVEKNTSPHGTAFCESIDARHGISTGISAQDRSTTVLAAVSPTTQPADLVRPGHVFPAAGSARRCAGARRPN